MTGRAQGTALLLVDLQNDFLERSGLVPERDALCARAAALVAAIRRRRIPVVHAHTLTRADGSDRMPHWRQRGVWQCVEGTNGALAPPALAPAANELVVHKRYFSAFADHRLDAWLRENAITRLLVSGVYLHGCVRATVLDAYERGYEVCVVEDAVGTTEPLHAELTRAYLSERGTSFRRLDEIVAALDDDRTLRQACPEPSRRAQGEREGSVETDPPTARAELVEARFARPSALSYAGSTETGAELPLAVIAGSARAPTAQRRFLHRNPCRTTDVLTEVPVAGAAEIDAAVGAAANAYASWGRTEPALRAEILEHWAGDLAAQREFFIDLIVREVAKPRRFAEEEVGRAVAHARAAAALARDPAQTSVRIAPGVRAAQRPLGIVGLITPWNNPLAIAVGKIAPALAFGNAVVVKPAPQASATALAIVASLDRCGVPAGVVNVVLGDAEAARMLCRAANVAAISVTGSLPTGRAVAAHCAETMKPVQAELGGNNAAIVLGDADLDRAVPSLVRAAFGFAGQRCTAIRRFVVEQSAMARFETLAREATRALVNGEPGDASTEVGPLISAEKRDRILTALAHAASAGARLVAGGDVPRHLAHGAWIAPALLADVDPRSRIAQEETFGPVAVILRARDLEDAIAIANGVPQGLVLSACTASEAARTRIREAAQAGIIQLVPGPLAVHPLAPFSGWKASGLGPPEHGIWDAAFYTRAQAIYTDEPC